MIYTPVNLYPYPLGPRVEKAFKFTDVQSMPASLDTKTRNNDAESQTTPSLKLIQDGMIRVCMRTRGSKGKSY